MRMIECGCDVREEKMLQLQMF